MFILLQQSGRINFDKVRHMRALSASFEREISSAKTPSNNTLTRKPSSSKSKITEQRVKNLERKSVDESTEFVRSKFNTKEFITEYSISSIIAANFFQVLNLDLRHL